MMTKEMTVRDFATTNAPAIAAALPNFGLALADFVDALQSRIIADYASRYPNLKPSTVTTEPGSKYVKIIVNDAPGSSRSVHSFVRIADGAILYAAGWKKPFIAKSGPNSPQTVRGSIYVNKGMDGVTVYGAVNVR